MDLDELKRERIFAVFIIFDGRGSRVWRGGGVWKSILNTLHLFIGFQMVGRYPSLCFPQFFSSNGISIHPDEACWLVNDGQHRFIANEPSESLSKLTCKFVFTPWLGIAVAKSNGPSPNGNIGYRIWEKNIERDREK